MRVCSAGRRGYEAGVSAQDAPHARAELGEGWEFREGGELRFEELAVRGFGGGSHCAGELGKVPMEGAEEGHELAIRRVER